METNKENNFGAACSFILFVVFLILKLCHVIDWSWIWVTCPLWIGLAVYALIIIVALAILWISKANKNDEKDN